MKDEKVYSMKSSKVQEPIVYNIGLYFGTMIEAWYYNERNGEWQRILSEPNVICFQKTHKILLGTAAQKYTLIHPNRKVFRMYEEIDNICNEHGCFTVYGKDFSSKDLLLLIMQQLHDKICKFFQTDGIIRCVVAVSSTSLLQREFLRRVMSQTNFQVLRVINSAVACASYFTLTNDYVKVNDSLNITCIVAEYTGITKVYAECENGVMEILGISQHTVNDQFLDSGEIMFEGVGCYFMDGLEQTIIDKFWQHTPKDINVKKVNSCAAIGAAFILLKLTGKGGDTIANWLLLDILARDITLLLEDSTGNILRTIPHMLRSEECLPVKSKTQTVVLQKNVKSITLLEDHYYKNISLSNTPSFFKDAEGDEVCLTVDEGGIIDLIIVHKTSGDIYNTNTVNSLEKHSVRITPQAACTQICEIIDEFALSIKNLQKDSYEEDPVLSGLKLIAGNCEKFKEIWSGDSIFDHQNVRQMFIECISLMDDMDYGLRSANLPFDTAMYLLFWTKRKLMDCLYAANVQPVYTEGEAFDLRYQEAVSLKEYQNVESDLVSEEIRSGYLLDGKLLRAALVEVTA